MPFKKFITRHQTQTIITDVSDDVLQRWANGAMSMKSDCGMLLVIDLKIKQKNSGAESQEIDVNKYYYCVKHFHASTG